MTAKEYLSQARYLGNRIKSKLLQIDSLNELATRCTPSYSDMPKSPNHEGSRMESAILDIIELEDEISKDVVELVALKKEIVEVIKQVGNTEYWRSATSALSHGSRLQLIWDMSCVTSTNFMEKLWKK